MLGVRCMIRSVSSADISAITRIYNHYITDTIVTFEEQPLAPIDIEARIKDVTSTGLPWLAAEENGQVVGYAYARQWNSRCAYRLAMESTVYLHQDCTGRGLGSLLYRGLFRILQDRGIHAVIAGIALPNDRSVALHEKFGMQKVAHFREVGYKFGRWIDVGYWERLL